MADDEEQPQLTKAQWRAQFEANMAKWRADVEFTQTSFEATITCASTTIRSLLILNGAAAIAILTFVGDQSKRVPGFNVQSWLPAFERPESRDCFES
ncbi:MAG TPA: hypothetical protein VKA94_14750 [Hyphomicrobiales bacterium]|nr:hypothetical protein [Hyphomicrobiales bacterium]